METATLDPRATGAVRARAASVAVISHYGRDVLTPRGRRTQEIARRLADEYAVELLAAEVPVRVPRSSRMRRLKRLVRSVALLALLDTVELQSRRALSGWEPECAAALIVAAPFSPAVLAAARLREAGIPYVLDIGDPWVLTARPARVHGLALLRARRAEGELWRGASGAIVTTGEQRERLNRRFPALSVLVRPNGCSAFDFREGLIRRQGRDSDRTLRLVHYGNLYSARIDLTAFLSRLPSPGRPVELHVFGSDWDRRLRSVRGLPIVFHGQEPWSDLVGDASRFDAALAVGNRDGAQLPSKAIEYLTLPIPRVAVVEAKNGDALAEYVSDKPGWLTVETGDRSAADAIAAHAGRSWTAEQLSPPAAEDWHAVSELIASFFKTVIESSLRSSS